MSKRALWIHHYQLFLFDFDGLLVNTERIHYLAYKNMLAARGINFSWGFDRYCQAAHYEADRLRQQLYQEHGALLAQQPSWDILYAEKKQEISRLFTTGEVPMMPGAAQLLELLAETNIPRCVVTHSPNELVSIVRKKNPILNTIPHWVTREQYTRPKPDPECYRKAIQMYANPTDRIIGFEDTPRGIRALSRTSAKAVLIAEIKYPEIPQLLEQGVVHFKSLEHCLQCWGGVVA